MLGFAAQIEATQKDRDGQVALIRSQRDEDRLLQRQTGSANLDGMFGEVRRTCDQTLTVLARKEKQRQQAERQELLDSLRAVLSGAASKSTSQRLAAEYIPASDLPEMEFSSGRSLCSEQPSQNWSGQGESDCLIKTKHCDGLRRCWRNVISAQCSECQSDEIQTSAGKRRE